MRENVPAYIVLHDATLIELCRTRPQSLAELQNVSGIGERKAAAYGAAILEALEAFLSGARAARREEVRVFTGRRNHAAAGRGTQF